MNKNCSVYNVSNLIGKRWTILIVLELYKGDAKWKRFNELKIKLPQITSKMLSARLKELEKSKVLTKRVDSSVMPIKSEYSLTKAGEEFIEVIQYVKKWAIKYSDCKCGPTCKSKNCKECEL